MKKMVRLLLSCSLVLSLLSIFVPALALAETNDKIEYKITYETDVYTNAKFLEGVTLHYGLNGWDNIQDVPMQLKTIPGTNGVPEKIWYEAIVTVNKNDTIDYAYLIHKKLGLPDQWDNNDGKDYHVTVTASNVEKIQYKITYKEYAYPARYSSAKLHYGLNGWNNVKDVEMEKRYEGDYAIFEAIVDVCEYDVIDYAFFIDTRYFGTYWVNNDGKDFHVQVIESNIQE